MSRAVRLGVNIDHVATVRNARGGSHPDPLRAARAAARAGADGITAHLREDRRHITDDDLDRLARGIDLPLNIEMAATEEILEIALRHRPHAVCIVPERRAERTTEGGLDVIAGKAQLKPFVEALESAEIRVSLFIEPDVAQIDAALAIGASVVELHTGAYCNAEDCARAYELDRIRNAAANADRIGLECHAGHGLGYDTVGPIVAIPAIAELNIGHFLVGEAIFTGLEDAIRRMRTLMEAARAGIEGARSA